MVNTKTIDEILDFISTKPKPLYNEIDRWFYHNDYPPFFGTSAKIVRKYSLSNGGMWKLSTLQTKQCSGWVVDKKLLNKLYRTNSGQWRINKNKL